MYLSLSLCKKEVNRSDRIGVMIHNMTSAIIQLKSPTILVKNIRETIVKLDRTT
jgi:hypothetical protein